MSRRFYLDENDFTGMSKFLHPFLMMIASATLAGHVQYLKEENRTIRSKLTGSAGWMYRLIVESLLGLHLEVNKLRLTPCLPADWTTFQIHYRYRETFYHITIHNSGARATVCRLALDGVESSCPTTSSR